MPAYRRPAITRAHAHIPHGTLHKATIHSRALGGTRTYAVYLPPGYVAARGPYACAVFHDGGDYLDYGEARVILDNLIAAAAIPRLVAVFVPRRSAKSSIMATTGRCALSPMNCCPT
jgi:enterochelin esterase-like enzyme